MDLSPLPVQLLDIRIMYGIASPGVVPTAISAKMAIEEWSYETAMRVIDDGNRICQNAEAEAGPNPVLWRLPKANPAPEMRRTGLRAR